MKASIYVDDFASAEWKRIARDGGNGATNILRRAPALNGRQTIRDEFVVFFLHCAGHIRGDDTGTNLINIDAALSMLTPLFASRLAEHGINVYEIRPGVIATDMTGAVKEKYDKLIADGLTPIQRWGTPEDVGRAVAAIASDAFPFSTGEVINVDGGFHLRRL